MNLKDLLMDALSEHLGRQATEEEFRKLAPLCDESKGHRTMAEVFAAYDALEKADGGGE